MARPTLNVVDIPSSSADQRLMHALGVPFARAAETSSTGFALVDHQGIVQWSSAAFSRLTRVTGAMLGAPLARRLDESFRLADGEADALFAGRAAGTLELYEGRTGTPTLLHVAALDGDVRVVVAVSGDQEPVLADNGAVDALMVDTLTRLGNRHRLEQRLLGHESPDAVYSLIVVGLDGFELHNEGLGRLACDQLLALVADRLRRACRGDDLVVRLQGDTFAILHDTIAGANSTARIAVRVAATLDHPFAMGDDEFMLDGSVGIAISGRATTRRADLVEHALAAMAAAKRAGGRTWREFDPGLLDEPAP